jgi:hypothetical protein
LSSGACLRAEPQADNGRPDGFAPVHFLGVRAASGIPRDAAFASASGEEEVRERSTFNAQRSTLK